MILRTFLTDALVESGPLGAFLFKAKLGAAFVRYDFYLMSFGIEFDPLVLSVGEAIRAAKSCVSG